MEMEMEMEKLYLVCNGCGEVFDEMITAKDHETTVPCVEDGYNIIPESEAF